MRPKPLMATRRRMAVASEPFEGAALTSALRLLSAVVFIIDGIGKLALVLGVAGSGGGEGARRALWAVEHNPLGDERF